MRVAFEGEYSAEEDEAGILFRGEFGDVRYGLAFAFDADGLRVEVPERLVDGAIELRVPAGFLARARFPVTLDPLVHTLDIETGPEECLAPDVAYEDSTGGYLYVYECVFSQSAPISPVAQ